MKTLISLFFTFSSLAFADEIPDWYKRDIEQHINEAPAVILYEITEVTHIKTERNIYTYRIDSKTIENLKGKAPSGNCYLLHSEGEWDGIPFRGERQLVILNVEYKSDCGVIEPGYSAPGKKNYVSMFKALVSKGT